MTYKTITVKPLSPNLGAEIVGVDLSKPLSNAQFDDIHLAVVDRSGAFELHLQTLRGRKLLKQAEFKLKEIFAPPTKPTAKPAEKLVDDSQRDLPAIFRVSPFPLRVDAAARLLVGQAPSAARIREAAEHCVQGSLPLAGNRHKVHLAVNLAERVMTRALLS